MADPRKDKKPDIVENLADGCLDGCVMAAAVAITKLLRPLTEQQRKDVIAELPFCSICWGDQPSSGRCQCWNDE